MDSLFLKSDCYETKEIFPAGKWNSDPMVQYYGGYGAQAYADTESGDPKADNSRGTLGAFQWRMLQTGIEHKWKMDRYTGGWKKH